MKKSGIDIILPWVDGTDKEWLNQYYHFADIPEKGDQRSIRFRDWRLLRYWFRGVEQFMPWVDTIHFITSGHFPDWLNLDHPKLNWIKHKDFIPEKYLPTFNANTIELNIHRIERLSGQFIYFNDDIFILKQLNPDRFFKYGLPCDYGVMTAKPVGGGIVHMAISDLDVINLHFDKHTQMRKKPSKWFSLKYGKGLINNILLYPWTDFSGFIDPHSANAFLKNTFDDVWLKAEDILDKTCTSKFRSDNHVNQWLMRYWQLASNNFCPYNIPKGSFCSDIADYTISDISNIISKQKYELVCLNDSDDISDFDRTQVILENSFKEIFPTKSTYEKY